MKLYFKQGLLFAILLCFTLFAACQNEDSNVEEEKIIQEVPLLPLNYVPENYQLTLEDTFTFFDTNNWSKGLTHDTDPSIKMIWNKTTGGEHLLNDSYAGYLLGENVYTKNGHLYLDNKKETIEGTDPVGTFQYSTGWINSLQKINFNGTNKGVYIEIKAKFPRGEKVWPAIWLVDDSENRGWPPEVDIWEYFGKFFNTNKKDQMYMRYIYGLWNDKKDHSIPINNFQRDYNASNEWHVYGYQWTNTTMKWFIDGKLVHTKTKGVDVPTADWPDKQMCLIINNGLMCVASDVGTVFPNSLILDYLEVYQEK